MAEISHPKLKLTLAERMLLYRRRLGITKEAHWKQLDMPRRTYLEMGDNPSQVPEPLRTQMERDVPDTSVTANEYCVIKRTRSGMTHRQLAKAVKLSVGWVRNMEQGHHSCDKLVGYWKVQ